MVYLQKVSKYEKQILNFELNSLLNSFNRNYRKLKMPKTAIAEQSKIKLDPLKKIFKVRRPIQCLLPPLVVQVEGLQGFMFCVK